MNSKDGNRSTDARYFITLLRKGCLAPLFTTLTGLDGTPPAAGSAFRPPVRLARSGLLVLLTFVVVCTGGRKPDSACEFLSSGGPDSLASSPSAQGPLYSLPPNRDLRTQGVTSPGTALGQWTGARRPFYSIDRFILSRAPVLETHRALI